MFLISVLVSQSLMDLFSTLFCIEWVRLVVQARSNPERRRPLLSRFGLEKVFVAMVVVAIIGFALNPMDLQYALTRIIEYKWILIMYVMIEILQVLKPSRSLLSLLLGLMLFINLVNVGIFLTHHPFFDSYRYGLNDFVRAGGFFGNPMTFAHSFVLFFCTLVAVFLMDQKNWKNWQRGLGVVVIALSALSLYWTYTRGVWIAMFAASVLILLFRKPFVAIGLAIVLVGGGFTLYKYNDNFRYRINITLGEAQGASERKVLWSNHFQIFEDHPIFGVGYGQNTKVLPEYYEKNKVAERTLVSHAHNQYLHLAAGTGVIGLLLYLLMWGFFFWTSILLWRNPNLDSWDRGIVIGFLTGQVAFCIGSLTEANFEHSKVRFVVMILWSYLIYLAKKYQSLPSHIWHKGNRT